MHLFHFQVNIQKRTDKDYHTYYTFMLAYPHTSHINDLRAAFLVAIGR